MSMERIQWSFLISWPTLRKGKTTKISVGYFHDWYPDDRNSGIGDFGKAGIDSFVEDHKCGSLCSALQLVGKTPVSDSDSELDSDSEKNKATSRTSHNKKANHGEPATDANTDNDSWRIMNQCFYMATIMASYHTHFVLFPTFFNNSYSVFTVSTSSRLFHIFPVIRFRLLDVS